MPPEATHHLVGHAEAELWLLDAYRERRLHHAWLLDGPEGVGKATLAYRFARFLLAHPRPEDPEIHAATDLSVSPDAPVARQVSSRVHPNLFVLERPRDDKGKPTATVIPVDQVRRLGQFLGGTAGGEGWRIVIVDAADDLNRASANALLKMLEEPPGDTIFLVVAHQAGRLLPTIRSRCRRLRLNPLTDEAMRAALPDVEGDLDRLVALSNGSPGRARRLVEQEEDGMLGQLTAILDGLPRTQPRQILGFAERYGRRDREAFLLARGIVLDWIAGRVRRRAEEGASAGALAPWSEVWEKVEHAFAQAEILNLDRTQTFLGVFHALSECAAGEARARASTPAEP
ncbi:DNA polymerase III delta prime subunit [Lutibaculum baratangense AMV1]|uniref:DNA polymerase III delta prime subunit n=2 Tax=Lutibaculum TaxID=1358438 RepID=V4R8I9_9HYPH|nr:DNA polymerase III delta prime subunit [Lutibaculum baratangense AMV1]